MIDFSTLKGKKITRKTTIYNLVLLKPKLITKKIANYNLVLLQHKLQISFKGGKNIS